MRGFDAPISRSIRGRMSAVNGQAVCAWTVSRSDGGVYCGDNGRDPQHGGIGGGVCYNATLCVLVDCDAENSVAGQCYAVLHLLHCLDRSAVLGEHSLPDSNRRKPRRTVLQCVRSPLEQAKRQLVRRFRLCAQTGTRRPPMASYRRSAKPEARGQPGQEGGYIDASSIRGSEGRRSPGGRQGYSQPRP